MLKCNIIRVIKFFYVIIVKILAENETQFCIGVVNLVGMLQGSYSRSETLAHLQWQF